MDTRKPLLFLSIAGTSLQIVRWKLLSLNRVLTNEHIARTLLSYERLVRIMTAFFRHSKILSVPPTYQDRIFWGPKCSLPATFATLSITLRIVNSIFIHDRFTNRLRCFKACRNNDCRRKTNSVLLTLSNVVCVCGGIGTERALLKEIQTIILNI